MQNTSLITIKDNQTAFIPYLVAGHTSNKVFSSALRLLNDVGADLIEIGIPFTDPIAEGKIIESAHHHALKHDFVLDDVCQIVKEFRTYSDTPVIAMGYTNSFINPSSEHIASKLSECGFNGVLIVDLPASEKSIINAFKDKQLNFVQLIAPTTTVKRPCWIWHANSARFGSLLRGQRCFQSYSVAWLRRTQQGHRLAPMAVQQGRSKRRDRRDRAGPLGIPRVGAFVARSTVS